MTRSAKAWEAYRKPLDTLKSLYDEGMKNKLIVLKRYSEEPEAGFILRMKSTVDYASEGTRFAVESQDTLKKVRAAGVMVPISVLGY